MTAAAAAAAWAGVGVEAEIFLVVRCVSAQLSPLLQVFFASSRAVEGGRFQELVEADYLVLPRAAVPQMILR